MRFVSIALLFLALSSLSAAQASWKTLNAIEVGQKIQVIEMNSKKHSGTFLSLSDSAITFQEGASERSVQKQDVRSVKLRTQRRFRNALIGAGVGGGIGGALGAAAAGDGGFVSRPAAAAVMGTMFAVIGASIGAVLPTRNTVYKEVSH
jgi:hypothetical protein